MTTVYNYAYSLGFDLESDDKEHNISGGALRWAIIKRLRALTNDELIEACGCPIEIYEVEELIPEHINITK